MTKYTSNEQYEKDKAAIILTIGNVPVGEGMTIADLLRQSKWIGAFDVTTYEDGYRDGYIAGAKDEDEEDG